MKLMETTFNFKTLPESITQVFLKVRTANYIDSHRSAVKTFKFNEGRKKQEKGVLALGISGATDSMPEAKYKEDQVIWATDNYESKDKKYSFLKPVNDLSVITPRIEKSKEVQKQRTKEKAEVFTPSWVCNLQNNLIDDETVYPGAFNTVDSENGIEGQKTWLPNPNPVFDKLNEVELKKAVGYIMARRLEATCGEAPYLASRYDTVSGDFIPVVNDNGAYQRIGLLDRKLRVVNEIANDESEWIALSLEAMKATYGYEWQGDNLLLARLNIFNSFIEYYEAFFGLKKTQELVNTLTTKEENTIDDNSHLLLKVANIVSWNLWQMDGLKMVTPMSCDETCSRCAKEGIKENSDKYNYHNGQVAVIRWGDKVIAFEDFLINKDTPIAKPLVIEASTKNTEEKKAATKKKPQKIQKSLLG